MEISNRFAGAAVAGLIAVVAAAAHPLVASAATTVAVGPGEGVTVSQVDYNWDLNPDTDSTTGELTVDIPTLTAATGMTSGFIKVGTSLGWVVQNLPIDAVNDPYPQITTQFDLSTSAAGLTSHGNGDALTASFIISDLCAGEHVELGYIYPNGGGHWVELTGAGSILGVPWITYVSDHDQSNDGSGTGKVDFSFLRDTDRDGLLNLVNQGTTPNATIVVTESPATPQKAVPEAPFVAPFGVIGLGALLALHRRRKRALAAR
jgi:hypothetical protein